MYLAYIFKNININMNIICKLQHSDSVIYNTDRLKFITLNIEHKDNWIRLHKNSFLIRYLSDTNSSFSDENSDKKFDQLLNHKTYNQDGFICVCAVFEKETNEFIGFMDIYKISPYSNIVSFSFLVDPLQQGKGYGTEIVRGIIRYLSQLRESNKDLVQLEYLESQIHDDNIPSIKVMEKVGFKKIIRNVYIKGFIGSIYRIRI